MRTLKEFRYFDPETRRSVDVPAGSEVSERMVNILGDKKVEQLARTRFTGDESVVPVQVAAPKRGRPKKKGA